MQNASHLSNEAEIVLAKLSVDQRRRIFVSKEAGRFLNVLPGDKIILSRQEDSNSLLVKVQRAGHVAETFLLIPLNSPP